MTTAIQFLRTSTPSLRPNPTTLADGMPMINTNETDPGLFFRSQGGELIKIGPCVVSSDAPNTNAQGLEGNSVGEMWLDTSGITSPRLRIWTGTAWTTDADVTLDEDQTITGQKTFTQTVVAQGGVVATGQDLTAESLNLSGTGNSTPTLETMPPNVLATKGYVDTKAGSATLGTTLSAGAYIQGNDFNGSANVEWSLNASALNNGGAIVVRDNLGNFAAGTITATLNGAAADCSRSVNTGNGLSGGGGLTQDLNLVIDPADDTLVTDSSGVKVNPLSTTLTFWTPNATGAHYLGGDVGIGTATPAATLDVDGYMKLQDRVSDPTSGSAGMLASVNGELKYHNGTAWVTVTTS